MKPAADADAELIHLVAEHARLRGLCDASQDDDEIDRYGKLISEAHRKLEAMPVQTPDGVAAKVRHLQYLSENFADDFSDMFASILDGLQRIGAAGSVNPAKTDWLAMLEEYRERMGDEAAAVRANQHDTDVEYRATEIATEATQSVEHRIAEAEADGPLGLAVKLAVLWNNSIADTADSHDDNALMVGSALDYLVKQTGIDPYVTYDRDCKPIRELAKIRGAS